MQVVEVNEVCCEQFDFLCYRYRLMQAFAALYHSLSFTAAFSTELTKDLWSCTYRILNYYHRVNYYNSSTAGTYMY